MKKLLTTTSLIVSSSMAFASAEDFVNEIIQINYEKGKQPHFHTALEVAEKGSNLASEAIMGRAEFRLTAKRINESKPGAGDKGKKYTIDVTSVASFETNAQLKAVGPLADPHNTPDQKLAHRTRIGEGYTLALFIEGLQQPGPDISAAESSVYVEQQVYGYEVDRDGKITKKILKTVPKQYGYEELGASDLDITEKVIDFKDVTASYGEEKHVAFMKPDENTSYITPLDETTILVFPIGDGGLSIPPLPKGNKVYRTVPPFDFWVKNLYPESETYVEVSGGKLKEKKNVPIIHTKKRLAPFSNSFQNNNGIRKIIEEAGAGTYRLDMYKATPFDTVFLKGLSLPYDPELKIRGNMTNSE